MINSPGVDDDDDVAHDVHDGVGGGDVDIGLHSSVQTPIRALRPGRGT
jgi:hypothetical protein